MSFWDTLQSPIYALAPMADVTDPAYRKLVREVTDECGGVPYVTWTEFVSADGLYHTKGKGKLKDEDNPLLRDLQFTDKERPIVAQLFSSNPEAMEYAAELALSLGFDGVDINMGCPDKSIEKQGAGAAHIKNPERAQEVIRAAIRGVKGQIPVSVKTRLGYNTIEYEKWFPYLLSEDIAALTIHLRTRKEMSKVPAHWELGKELIEFCRGINGKVRILGNGDISTLEEGRKYIEEYGFDGVMIGRGVFGNPWLFTDKKEHTQEERIEMLHRLAKYFVELTPVKHYAILKKHFKAFIQGFDGAAELRAQLMDTTSFEEFEKVVNERTVTR